MAGQLRICMLEDIFFWNKNAEARKIIVYAQKGERIRFVEFYLTFQYDKF